MNEYIDRNDDEEMHTTETESVNTEPVVETPSPSQKKIVSNEQFIRAWNGAEYLSEAAEAMGIQPESARARAAKLRKNFNTRVRRTHSGAEQISRLCSQRTRWKSS